MIDSSSDDEKHDSSHSSQSGKKLEEQAVDLKPPNSPNCSWLRNPITEISPTNSPVWDGRPSDSYPWVSDPWGSQCDILDKFSKAD